MNESGSDEKPILFPRDLFPLLLSQCRPSLWKISCKKAKAFSGDDSFQHFYFYADSCDDVLQQLFRARTDPVVQKIYLYGQYCQARQAAPYEWDKWQARDQTPTKDMPDSQFDQFRAMIEPLVSGPLSVFS